MREIRCDTVRLPSSEDGPQRPPRPGDPSGGTARLSGERDGRASAVEDRLARGAQHVQVPLLGPVREQPAELELDQTVHDGPQPERWFLGSGRTATEDPGD